MGKYKPIIVTADCGSLTRAGKILGYAQPNMGSIVTRFENELGVKLFTRSKHGVTMTKTGEKLIDIMRQIDAMEDYLQEVSIQTRTERFRTGVFQSVATQWMPQVMTEFLQAYPNTVFQMEHLSSNLDGETGILENRLDCAFFCGTHHPDGMQCVPLISEPFYLLVPDHSPLSDAAPITLDEAAGTHPYIHAHTEFDSKDFQKEVQKSFMAHNIIKVSAPEDSTVISLVSQGLGMSLIPKLSLSGVTPSHHVKAIPLKNPPARTISLLFSKNAENPTLISFFLQLLQRYITEQN